MGRRSKIFDKRVRDTILEYIRNGNYLKTACLAAGIREQTFYNWQSRAEQYKHGDGNVSDEDKIYLDFLEELKTAEEENIARNVAIIQKAAESNHPNSWYPAAWLLERKRPAEYGKRMELEVGPSKVLLALQDLASKSISASRVKQIDAGDTALPDKSSDYE